MMHATILIQCMYYARKLHNRTIHVCIWRIERSVNISIMLLLLAMISLHMLTFSLMATMVAESSFIIHCWER